MDLRQLDHFLAIFRRGSISAAAEELGVAQPTLTKSLRMLEASLGVALFKRHPRGVDPTEHGHVLARRGRTLRLGLNDAVHEIAGQRGLDPGPVRLGVGPSWLRRYCPTAIARTLAACPGARFQVSGGVDDALIGQLVGGQLDLVVAELPPLAHMAGLDAVPLTEDTHRVCCRRGHALAHGGRVDPADLLRFDWVGPPATSRSQVRLHGLFTALNLPGPRFSVVSDNGWVPLELVQESDLLAFVVSTSVLPGEHALVFLDVPELAMARQAGILLRATAWRSLPMQAFMTALGTLCSDRPRN